MLPGWPKMLPCLWIGCGKLRLSYSPGDRYCTRCRYFKERVAISVCEETAKVIDRRRGLDNRDSKDY